ncbi:MAG: Uma2 family endonuclease [Myxococcales bacterium]|nr:Uma2 family endonuclease [Myxococcales bacterium]
MRRELLDFEVIVSPRPFSPHQHALVQLAYQLETWARRSGHFVLTAPFDIRFAPGTILEPDVMVFHRRLRPDEPMPLTTMPMLCVEVLSPSSVTYDRHTKRLVHARAGVGEHWIVDPSEPSIERFHGPDLRARAVATHTLVAETLPGLSIDVAQLAL